MKKTPIPRSRATPSRAPSHAKREATGCLHNFIIYGENQASVPSLYSQKIELSRSRARQTPICLNRRIPSVLPCGVHGTHRGERGHPKHPLDTSWAKKGVMFSAVRPDLRTAHDAFPVFAKREIATFLPRRRPAQAMKRCRVATSAAVMTSSATATTAM